MCILTLSAMQSMFIQTPTKTDYPTSYLAEFMFNFELRQGLCSGLSECFFVFRKRLEIYQKRGIDIN